MPSSYLNLKKIGLGGKEFFRMKNPRTVTIQRISRNACCQPRLPVTANVAVRSNPGITSSRTRNPSEEWLPWMWQFTVTLYIRGIVPGITSSRMRKPPEELFSCWESQGHGRGIHRRNGIPLVITNAWTLIRLARSKCKKTSPNSNNSRISSSKLLFTANVNFFKIFIWKHK
jgi:hypothetical protein